MSSFSYGRLTKAVALTFGLVVCSQSVAQDATFQPANLGDATIVSTAVAAGTFNTLAAALEATGLDQVLSDTNRNFTVFAPTDEAFNALGQDTINALLNDRERLTDILLYHVVADTVVDAATVVSLSGQSTVAANGDNLSLNVEDGNVFVNLSRVTTADVGAINGIIHVIDRVLLPPVELPADASSLPSILETAVAAGSFNTLVAALQATGLDTTFASEGLFTVFAPTDAAFALLGTDTINALLEDTDTLSDILLYHVIPGQAINSSTAISLAGQSVQAVNNGSLALSLNDGNLLVNRSTVTTTDILTSNGIIHVIDAVLIPTAADTSDDGSLPNIVETLAANEDVFRTLSFALEQTGLNETLAGDGPFTLFAPTAKAMAALNEEELTRLLLDNSDGGGIDQLRDILLYHVIAGRQIDTSIGYNLSGQALETANGGSIVLNSDGQFTVNGVTVFLTNIETSNGIIHVIDTVLTPSSSAGIESSVDTEQTPSTPTDASILPNIVETLAADFDNFRTLSFAIEQAGLVDTLSGEGPFTFFAPTARAFNTLESLLFDVDRLRNVLLYHVIPGQKIDTSTAFGLSGQELVTVNGDTIVLNSDGQFTVNSITVFMTNIETSNGIIHVIDTVLLP